MLLARINQPMTVYRDCTMHELVVLFSMSLVACVFVGASSFALLFGKLGLGVCAGLPLSMALMPGLSKLLQLKKVGKPQGYYQLSAWLWLEDKGIHATPYLRRTGLWSTRVVKS